MRQREGTPFSWLEGTVEEVYEHALELIATGSYDPIKGVHTVIDDTGYLCCVQVARSALGRCRFCNVDLSHYACPECKRSIVNTIHSAFFLPDSPEPNHV
jgi:hypothetical protein